MVGFWTSPKKSHIGSPVGKSQCNEMSIYPRWFTRLVMWSSMMRAKVYRPMLSLPMGHPWSSEHVSRVLAARVILVLCLVWYTSLWRCVSTDRSGIDWPEIINNYLQGRTATISNLNSRTCGRSVWTKEKLKGKKIKLTDWPAGIGSWFVTVTGEKTDNGSRSDEDYVISLGNSMDNVDNENSLTALCPTDESSHNLFKTFIGSLVRFFIFIFFVTS